MNPSGLELLLEGRHDASSSSFEVVDNKKEMARLAERPNRFNYNSTTPSDFGPFPFKEDDINNLSSSMELSVISSPAIHSLRRAREMPMTVTAGRSSLLCRSKKEWSSCRTLGSECQGSTIDEASCHSGTDRTSRNSYHMRRRETASEPGRSRSLSPVPGRLARKFPSDSLRSCSSNKCSSSSSYGHGSGRAPTSPKIPKRSALAKYKREWTSQRSLGSQSPVPSMAQSDRENMGPSYQTIRATQSVPTHITIRSSGVAPTANSNNNDDDLKARKDDMIGLKDLALKLSVQVDSAVLAGVYECSK